MEVKLLTTLKIDYNRLSDLNGRFVISTLRIRAYGLREMKRYLYSLTENKDVKT